MTLPRILQRLLLLALTIGVLVVAFFAIVRPLYLNWGSTPAERSRVLPGDEIVPDAASYETRAITIAAPAEDVWPWLAQIGQDRSGFYSFDLLENLVGCEMPIEDGLKPEHQIWQTGDKLWMYPRHKAGGAGFATLRVYQPGRALGFGTRLVGTPLDAPENGSWSFVVEPIDAGSSRLLMRGRGSARQSLLGVAFDRGIFEPIHFFMERRMLVGIKELAETGARDRTANTLHVALWVITFTLCLVAAVFVVAQRAWQRPLAAFAVGAIVFQILTLAQPPLPAGLLLVVLTAALVGQWPGRARPAEVCYS